MPPASNRERTTLNPLERKAQEMNAIVETYLGPAGPEREQKLTRLNRYKRSFYDSFVISSLRIYGADPDQELRNKAANNMLGDLQAQVDTFVQNLNGIMKPEAVKAALALELNQVLSAATPSTAEIVETVSDLVPWMANDKVKTQFGTLIADPALLTRLNSLYKLSSDVSAEEIIGTERFNANPQNAPQLLLDLKKKLETVRGNVDTQGGTFTAPDIKDEAKQSILKALSRQIEKVDYAFRKLLAQVLIPAVNDSANLTKVTELLNREPGGALLPSSVDDIFKALSYLKGIDIVYKKALLEYYPGLEQKILQEISTNAAQLIQEANDVDTIITEKKKVLQDIDVIQSTLNEKSAQMQDMQNNDLDTGNSQANRDALAYFQAATAKLDLLSRTVDAIDDKMKTNPVLSPDNIKYLDGKSAFLTEWAADLARAGRTVPNNLDLVTAQAIIDDATRSTQTDTKKQIQDLYIQARDLRDALEVKIAKRFVYLDKIKEKLPDVESQARSIEAKTEQYDITELGERLVQIQKIVKETNEQDTLKFPELQLGIRQLETALQEANRTLILLEGELEMTNLGFTDLVSKHKHTKAELRRIVANFPTQLEFADNKITSISLSNLQELLAIHREKIDEINKALDKVTAKYDKRIAYTLVDDENDAKLLRSNYAQAMAKDKGLWIRNSKGQIHFFDNTEGTGPFILKLSKHPAEALLDGDFESVIQEIAQVLTAANYKGDRNKLIAKIIRSVLGDNYDLVPYDLVFRKLKDPRWSTDGDIRDVAQLTPSLVQNMLQELKDANYPGYAYVEAQLNDLIELKRLVILTNIRYVELNEQAIQTIIQVTSDELEDLKSQGISHKDDYYLLGLKLMGLHRIIQILRKMDNNYHTKGMPSQPVNTQTTTPLASSATTQTLAATAIVPVSPTAINPNQGPSLNTDASRIVAEINNRDLDAISDDELLGILKITKAQIAQIIQGIIDRNVVGDPKVLARNAIMAMNINISTIDTNLFNRLKGRIYTLINSTLPTTSAQTQVVPAQTPQVVAPVVPVVPVATPAPVTVPPMPAISQPNVFVPSLDTIKVLTQAELDGKLSDADAQPVLDYLHISPADISDLRKRLSAEPGKMTSGVSQFVLQRIGTNVEPRIASTLTTLVSSIIIDRFPLAAEPAPAPIVPQTDQKPYLVIPNWVVENNPIDEILMRISPDRQLTLEGLVQDMQPYGQEPEAEQLNQIKKIIAPIINQMKSQVQFEDVDRIVQRISKEIKAKRSVPIPVGDLTDSNPLNLTPGEEPQQTFMQALNSRVPEFEAEVERREALQRTEAEINDALQRVDRGRVEEVTKGLSSLEALKIVIYPVVREANPKALEITIKAVVDRLANEYGKKTENLTSPQEIDQAEETEPEDPTTQQSSASLEPPVNTLEPARERNSNNPFAPFSMKDLAELNKKLQDRNVKRIPAEQLLKLLAINHDDLVQLAKDIRADNPSFDLNKIKDVVKEKITTMLTFGNQVKNSIPSALKEEISKAVDSIPM